jgi:hypothetical protein
MKKILLPFVAIALLAGSCAKDYACVCTTGGETDTTPAVFKKVTKTWMKNEAGCVSYTDVEDGVSVETTCEIEKK